uniref:DegT/DnrJ/EryC1/StrS aminotransferase family protein n=1 Tax=viral metagenome TaxID=1070528 RepID=A0A6C0HZ60_9ZZZZ
MNNIKNVVIMPCHWCNFNYSCGGITCCFELAKELSKYLNVIIHNHNPDINHIYNKSFTQVFISEDLNEEYNLENTLVIYGETIEGNPLYAKYIMRWILAPLGMICSSDKYLSWNKTDLVYFFNNESKFTKLNTSEIHKNLTTIHINDYLINHQLERSGSCHTMRKSHLHKNIHNIHSNNSFLISEESQEELIKIFNEKEIFISYDPLTFLSIMAAMCGCISVIYKRDDMTKEEWIKNMCIADYLKETSEPLYGIAYGLEEICFAKNTIHLVEQQWSKFKNWLREKTVIPFVKDIGNIAGLQNTVDNVYYKKKIWYAPNRREAYGDAEIKAVTECLEDGWLAGFGPRTIEFEGKVAKEFGKKHGLFVNSGSSAILLGLSALDLPKGSEVITPACTFSTTVAPIIQTGLTPIFCDVQLGTYVPSIDQILEKITENTRMIMLPNLIGSKPDWATIRQKVPEHIILFEDSADTVTFTPDTDISITSFYSSHLITAAGSGGMLMVNDAKLLKRATMFRDWGRIGDNSEDVKTRFEYEIDGIPYDYKFLYGAIGYNMKSSEINAAFGLVQVSRLEEIRSMRKQLFQRYLENFKDIPELILPINTFDSDWLAIPFMYKNRLELLTFLENNSIQTRVCFAGNITRHPVYRNFLTVFQNADRIMAEGFLLGAHHGMTIEDVDYVCDKIKEFISSNP